MNDWQDAREPDYSQEPPKSRRWVGVVLALVVLGGAGAVAWFLFLKPQSAETDAAAETLADAGAAPPKLNVAESDALIRKLGTQFSSNTDLAQWLAGDDWARRLTAATNMVADGESPISALPFLQLQGEFEVVDKRSKVVKREKKKKQANKKRPVVKSKIFISPASYARYDKITSAFTSIDFASAGKAYAQVKPFLDAAFAEIGRPGKTFDEVLTAAIKRLLSVQVPDSPIEVQPQDAVYGFVDPSLESLSPAQKHLIRTGPKNAKAIQTALQTFAQNAGLAVTP